MTSPETVSMDALLAHLVDTSLRNYTVDELAALLRCKPRYIEDNLKKLPHHKIGVTVSFDAAQVRQIKEMHRVHPLDADEPDEPDTADTQPSAAVAALAQIQPSAGRRQRVG